MTNSDYIDSDGIIRMCKVCRSVKLITETEKWITDTILYASPPDNVVFELCPACSKKEDYKNRFN